MVNTIGRSKVTFKGILKAFHSNPAKVIVITSENNLPYAATIHEGRKPGSKPPPAAALKDWAKQVLGDENLAYPVAKNIGKFGFAEFAHGGENKSEFLIRAVRDGAQENLKALKENLSRGDSLRTAAMKVGDKITVDAGMNLDPHWKRTGELANATVTKVSFE